MAHKRKKRTNPFWDAQEETMTPDEREQLFIHVLNHRGLYLNTLERLTPQLLLAQLEEHLLLLEACCDLNRETGLTPGDAGFKASLRTQLTTTAAGASTKVLYPESTLEELCSERGLLTRAFNVESGELDERVGYRMLKRFLTQQLVIFPIQDVMRVAGTVPANIGAVFKEFQPVLESLEGIDEKPLKTFGEEWAEHEARLEQTRNRELIGLRTGLEEFDRRTLGLRGLTVFGARPGAGKTTLSCVQMALGICRHHAVNDAVVVILSLDMDRFELYSRLRCNLGDMDWRVLTFGSFAHRLPGSPFSKEDLERLETARKTLETIEAGRRLVILDRETVGENVTPERLRAILEKCKRKVGAKRALLIIDYLQILPIPEEVEGQGDLEMDRHRIRLVQGVIEGTRSAEDRQGDAVLVISEARKPASSKEEWGDSMAELMGSARIAYAADAVLMYREMTDKEIRHYYGEFVDKNKDAAAEYKEALRKAGIAPVILDLDKGRDGMTRGRWAAEFSFYKSTFREITPESSTRIRMPKTGSLMPPGMIDGSEPAPAGHAASRDTPLPLPPAGPAGFIEKPRRLERMSTQELATSMGAATDETTTADRLQTGKPLRKGRKNDPVREPQAQS
jgi:replicative DNA helicase